MANIPGAWISSTELDDLSLPRFTTSSSSPQTALLLGSQAKSSPVPSLAPPRPKPSMSHLDRVVKFHRRISTSLFSQDSPRAARKGSRLIDFKTYTPPAAGTPQVMRARTAVNIGLLTNIVTVEHAPVSAGGRKFCSDHPVAFTLDQGTSSESPSSPLPILTTAGRYVFYQFTSNAPLFQRLSSVFFLPV